MLKYITRKDYIKVLNTARRSFRFYYYIFLLMGRLGLRPEEILRLKKTDFDFEDRTIKIEIEGFNDTYTTIRMTRKLNDIMKSYVTTTSNRDKLFLIKPRTLQKKFRLITRIAGILKYNISSIRNLRGVIIAGKNRNPYYIMEEMRLKNIYQAMEFLNSHPEN